MIRMLVLRVSSGMTIEIPIPILRDTKGLQGAALSGQIVWRRRGVHLAGGQSPDRSAEMTRLLLAVRDRQDRQAFGELFDHFAPRLKAMLIRSGLTDGSAEDVVQDVLLTVWHKAAQFDPGRAEAAGWIYRIARNRQIDVLRRRRIPMPDELGPPADDAAQSVALAQEARLLRAALSRLSAEQQEALAQAYMDDLPQSEISHRTGLPLGTVKSRIRLGLERLRHELRDLKP